MDEKPYTAATMPAGAAIYCEEWVAKLRWQRESARQSNRVKAIEMAMETLRAPSVLRDEKPRDGDEVLALAERYFRFIAGPAANYQPPRTERSPDDPDGLAV